MRCPYCGYQDSKVVDSRTVNDGIRRRRQCLHCSRRFTTYERVQASSFLVVKKDGRREEFDRDKLLSGIRKACAKRPIANQTIVEVVNSIERELHHLGKVEVPSSIVGELVIRHLRNLDRIAYIRFASVYREFADIESFKKEIDALTQGKEETTHLSAQLPLIPGKELGLRGGRRKRQNS